MKTTLAILLFGIFVASSNADESLPPAEDPPAGGIGTLLSILPPPEEDPEILPVDIELPDTDDKEKTAHEIIDGILTPEDPKYRDEEAGTEEGKPPILETFEIPPLPEGIDHVPLEGSLLPDRMDEYYRTSGGDGMPELLAAYPSFDGSGEMPEMMNSLDLVEEHEMTEEMRMMFGLAECGTVDASTCNNKMPMKVWACEFSSHLREVKDWLSQFGEWW